MKVLLYSTNEIERPFLEKAAAGKYELAFVEETLSIHTVHLSKGYQVISVFTDDDVSAAVLKELGAIGVQLITIRAAVYENIDVTAAQKYNIQVVRVPGYSPEAI